MCVWFYFYTATVFVGKQNHDKVIDFPMRERIGEQNYKTLMNHNMATRERYIDDLALNMLRLILKQFQKEGFPVECSNDALFLSETIRSILRRANGFDHPLQQNIDEHIRNIVTPQQHTTKRYENKNNDD